MQKLSKTNPQLDEWLSKEAKFQAADLELCRNFADSNSDKFDDEFLTSLEWDFERSGFLTEKQYAALTNIINKWHMAEWAERD